MTTMLAPIPMLLPQRATPAPAPTPLTERALLVSLHFSMWQGHCIDRRVTGNVLTAEGAQRDAGHWEKQLLPKKALDGVIAAHRKAKNAHNRLTAPWDDNAQRILNGTLYFEYIECVQQQKSACEAAHRAFYDAYPEHQATAPERMGGTYDPADFPDVSELPALFGVRLVVLPMPDSRDFRVALGADHEVAVRADIERTVAERFQAAHEDLFEQVHKALRTVMASTLNPKGRVYDSTFDKLKDLARLAPQLAITPSRTLVETCKAIEGVLEDVSADDLRERPRQRRATGQALRDIEAQLAGAF